jgi:signal transduction histidine kinase
VLPHIHAALIHLSAMPNDTTAQNAVTALSSAHRELSALIRTLPPATPHRLEHVGLVQTLHDLAKLDFGAAFDAVTWTIAPGVETKLEKTPLFVGEVVSYAVQETLRNAARHARGSESRRPLHVAVTVSWQHGLSIEIADDGVGIANSQTNGGSGAGLRLHRGLLGVLGGTLQIATPLTGGTLIRLFVPEDLWILPVIEGVRELE